MSQPDGGEGDRLTTEKARGQSPGESQPVIAERAQQRRRHDQAREHERDQHQPCGASAEVEVVGDPGDVVPRSPDGEQQDQRLECTPPGQAGEKMARQLRHGQDVHQIEEQLDRRDLGDLVAAHSQVSVLPRCR